MVIPAGGIGTRFGNNRPKQFLELNGVPILVRTCRAFLEISEIQAIALAVPAAHREESVALLREFLSDVEFARLRFTEGGMTRQDSVRAGLSILPPDIQVVLVHDAARPLIDADTIYRCLRGAVDSGAVIAAVPVHDTMKKVEEGGRIVGTLDRTGLWRAQTPQAARRDLLERAFALAAQAHFIGTDEASLLEAAGIPVRVVEGSEQNMKVTRPADLQLAATYVQEQNTMKIGHGFDAHRLVSERPLILGGVHIDYELGLDGHSDADVVAHALTDALLGALGQGDLGRHFPDSDPQYKGIDSLLLLAHVQQLMEKEGLVLGNADITIVCQKPKLAPYLGEMQKKLAHACKAAPDAINIKATTTEHMGYTGRGEGIAAHAVVLVR